jgi:hypothetical protein
MTNKNPTKSDPQKTVRLVDTSLRPQAESCNAAEAAAQLQYVEKPAGRKGLQPGLKGWLDGVILPILIGDVLDDNSGEFNSRGLCNAIRYLRALFFQPPISSVD